MLSSLKQHDKHLLYIDKYRTDIGIYARVLFVYSLRLPELSSYRTWCMHDSRFHLFIGITRIVKL